MKRPLLFFCLLGALFACDRGPSLPDQVLSPEKMEPLLWEMLEADQFVSSFVIGRDTAVSAHAMGPKLYQAILKKYGVTDSVFQASLAYYKANPKQFLPMLDSLSKKPDLAPTSTVDSLTPIKIDSPAGPAAVPQAPQKPTGLVPKPLAY